MIKHLITTATLALTGSAVVADVAVLITDGSTSRQAARAESALVAQGFELYEATRKGPDDIAALLAEAFTAAEPGEAVVVYLGGTTVQIGARTYHASSRTRGITAFNAGARATDIGVILDAMAAYPGRALLLIGEQRAPITLGDVDRPLGQLVAELPAGVTLVSGSAPALLGNLERLLRTPGASVQESFSGQLISGYAPDGVAFLPEAPDTFGTLSADAEEELYWQLAQDMGTSDALRAYLRRYPAGLFAADAERTLDAYRADPALQAEALERNLGLDRAARRAVQADLTVLGFDTRGVDGILGRGSRAALSAWQGSRGFVETGYLTANQLAALSGEAETRRAEERRADSAYWARTGINGSERGLRAYLDRYPDGIHAANARRSLAEFEDARAQSRAAADRRRWEDALDTGSVAGFESYLREFPDGLYAEDAREEIERRSQPSVSDAQIARDRSEEGDVLGNPILKLLAEQRMTQLGYGPGRVDGRFDDATRAAIRAFQTASGLPATGYVSRATGARLLSSQ
ncbi:MAG: peptidoglycan-binding protein [Pseudomonadota bacterium]